MFKNILKGDRKVKKMKKKRAVTVLALVFVAILALGAFSGVVIRDTGAKNKKGSNYPIKLGLDLAGGVSITYEIQDKNPSKEDVDDTIAKLERRIENYSTEYSVYKSGSDRIAVEIPGLKDANKILEELGNPGTLYFIRQTGTDGKQNYTRINQTGDSEKDYKLTKSIDELKKDGSIIMTGTDVAEVAAGYSGGESVEGKAPVVNLELKSKATKIFAEETAKAHASGQSIAIFYDGKFLSVPTVSATIKDGRCEINGFTKAGRSKDENFQEAKKLATFIRAGAINLKLKEIESNVVGASLGGKALENSLIAGAVGLVLVIIFMIIGYKVPGCAASLALIIYTGLVISIVQLYEITLTLPGIAGIVLGIGMAVDANVITFARIKEEIAAGKSSGNAITEGYKKAFSAIMDGNVTTMIAAIILMFLGSGTVKGFAYTLAISILASVFTAVVVSKFILKAIHALGVRDEKFYGRAKEKKVFKFVEHRVKYYAVSLCVIVAGIFGMIYYSTNSGKALNYSLEFMGGTSTTADFGKKYSIEQIEKDIVPVVRKTIKKTDIQATAVEGNNNVVVKTRTLSLNERKALASAYAKEFGIKENSIQTQSISSTISGEMRANALKAVIVSCICMLIYICIRFKDSRMGASAIIALVHDVLVVITLYALSRITAGTTFIAVMLTIVGYSVNDTIVIFDRIRENLKATEVKSKEKLREVADVSLSQTLARSINTSITTFIMVCSLYVFGVQSIRDFALPLMVGLIAGSYSSIFIATEIWYELKSRKLPKDAEKKNKTNSSKKTKKSSKNKNAVFNN
ncbi:SecD/SecF fusion protein [Lachnobacterium bovis]|uniref:Multifunctional fusion protein n=2 Tax=Lachnobacterium bovis TaxID=140626 RepID=A0A1H9U3M0_9FIRM|nr:SecD/SecF fusion protein [Lachnobacterium bovis]